MLILDQHWGEERSAHFQGPFTLHEKKFFDYKTESKVHKHVGKRCKEILTYIPLF